MTDTLRQKMVALKKYVGPPSDYEPLACVDAGIDKCISLLDEHCAGQQEKSAAFDRWWQDKINSTYFYQTKNRGFTKYRYADIGVCKELFHEGWQAAIATITGDV